ncbi:hypothetical protein ACRAQ6_14015 [Erythrobacter sp. HA6-11]
MSDLRQMLLKLAEIGQPSVSKTERGRWHCSVTFPAPEGVTAKVRSDFDHPTPEAALQCCIDRLGGLQDMLSVPTPNVGVSHAQIEH